MKFFKSFLFVYTRFFVIGLAVLLVIETGGLIYVNNVYLKDNDDYKTKKIIATSSAAAKYKPVTIDANASNVICSYERHYVSYLKDGVINIVDMTTGQKTTIANPDNMQVSYFKWLYDKDRMFIYEKKNNSYYAKMYTYDMKDKKLIEIVDTSNNSEYRISLSDTTDNVTGVDMSTDTGVSYFKISTQANRSQLYEMNASGHGLTLLSDTVTRSIGKIQGLKFEDKLLYESTAGKVYVYGYDTALSVNGVTSLGLLGFDSSDNVYLANTAGGTTKTIYCGSYDDNTKKWSWPTTIKLDKAVKASDIYVERDGTVYYNDEDYNCIVKVASDTSSSVSGASSSGASSAAASSSKASTSSKSSSSASSKSSGKVSGTSSASGKPANGISYTGTIIDVRQDGFLTLSGGKIVPYDFK